MAADIVYAFLISSGWAFLGGWLVALLVACVSAFRKDALIQDHTSAPRPSL